MEKFTDTRIRLLQVKEQLATAYKNGWSLREIAKVHNTAPSTIRALLIEEGVEMRKTGKRVKEK
jgi:IS30 family transposase